MPSTSTPIGLSAPFRLRTLGANSLDRLTPEGRWEPVLRAGKPLALLVFLASSDGRELPREQLADLLWGDESPERARGSLRQALHTLRRTLGDSVLTTDRDLVALRADAVGVDRTAALRAIRADALEALLDSYAGPFCPHLDVGRAVAFDRWLAAERGHLERLAVEAAVAGVGRLVTEGAVDRAVEAARRIVAAAPEVPEALAALADALGAAGAVAEARERLEAWVAVEEAAGRPLPPALRERLHRLRRAAASRPSPAVGTLEMLGRTMVGRKAPLATLLREAEVARISRPRRVALVAPAGMGKTRLLDEFESRMRLRGARVVRVRFLPGMRGVPFAGVADLVRALAAMPGALGVSGGSARALIGLVPELVTRYSSVELTERHAPERSLLARRDAVADLLAAVAEDRLVLVLLDDLQYADEGSRDLLASLPRGDRTRLLEVMATRPGLDPQWFAPDVTLALEPLGPVELRELLGELAALPDAPWVPEAVNQLLRRTGGVPHRLLTALRALVEAGALRLEVGGWVVPSEERIGAAIAMADGVPQVIGALVDTERRLLRLLAAWARPIDEVDLTAMLGPDASVSASLNRLAELGLVQSRDATWAVAHDAIVDGIDAVPATPDEMVPLDVFIEHWATHPRLTVAVLEHLAMLCGARGDLVAARRLVSHVSGRRPWRALGLRGRSLARAVARAAGRPDWDAPLNRAVGFLARQSDRGLALIGAGAAVAVGLVVWLLLMLQPRLVLESEPMAEMMAGEQGIVNALSLIVQPRVAVRNGFGQLLQMTFPVTVRVPNAIVHGDSVVGLRDGMHQFEDLVVEPDSARPPPRADEWRIDVSGPWYVRSASVRIRGPGAVDQKDGFRPVRLRVAGGQGVGPMHVRARLGDTLRFDLTFEYSTTGATANYIVAGTPTWGDRRASVLRLAGLPSPVQNAWRTVTFSVPPPPIGMHHVVILFALEDEAAHALSATNWAVGEPIWFDGNDVVDLPPDAFEALRVSGHLTIPRYLERFYQGRLPELRVGKRIISGPVPGVGARAVPWEYTGTAIRIDVVNEL